MRTITTTTGAAIELDGDLLAVLEALFKTRLAEPGRLIRTSTRCARSSTCSASSRTPSAGQYLSEALFMSYNTLRERPARARS